MSQPFSDADVTAVAAHMNGDHTADCLLIVRAFGAPTAQAARMSGMDGEAAEFVARVDGTDAVVRVPWSRPLTTRAEVRPEVVRLYEEANRVLGLQPRPPAAH